MTVQTITASQEVYMTLRSRKVAVNHLTKKVKGVFRHAVTQLIDGKNESFISPRKKILLVKKKAYALAKISGSEEEKTTYLQIAKRQEKNLKAMREQKEVRLPSFYHGTKSVASLENIVSGSLMVQEAAYGKGAYISSMPETDYGPYYVAFDFNDLAACSLAKNNVANDRKLQQDHTACWRALGENFAIDKKRFSYLVVETEEARTEVTKMAERLSLQTEVLLLDEANRERELFEEVQGIVEPKGWSSHWQDSSKHVIENALTKAFERFKPRQEEAESEILDSEWV